MSKYFIADDWSGLAAITGLVTIAGALVQGLVGIVALRGHQRLWGYLLLGLVVVWGLMFLVAFVLGVTQTGHIYPLAVFASLVPVGVAIAVTCSWVKRRARSHD